MTFQLREGAVLGRQRIQHYLQQLLHHQVRSMNILIDATRVSLFYSPDLYLTKGKDKLRAEKLLSDSLSLKRCELSTDKRHRYSTQG